MGEAALQRGRMTFEEAAGLDPDLTPGELDAGRFVPVPRSTWRHGKIVARVVVVLDRYASAHPGWSVSAGDPGTKLGHDPDLLRGPDVAIVRAEREPEGRGAQGWLEGAPDVAVEILGDRQAMMDLMTKALEYLAAGAKMAWILEPETARVVVFTPPGQVRILGKNELLEGGEALPGFSCRVGELFS
jgi:Uma2 family endonuclease